MTRQHYNEFEELDVTVTPEGYSRRTAFNEFGLPALTMDEDGRQTRYTYDARRNLTSVTTPEGRRTAWEYDKCDRVVERTLPGGESYAYTYEGSDLTAITDSEGRIFTLAYNERHELVRLTFPDRLHRDWRYDGRGRMVWSRDVLGNATTYAYDDADNVVRIEEADGNVHNLVYDASGNLIKASDMLHDVEFDYGPLGTLTGRRQFGRHVRFGYDSELQLREIVNAGGERYAFKLDGLGQVVEETSFDGLRRKYVRDGVGRVVRVVRPGGRQTDYELDGAGNVLEERHHDGRTSRFAFDGDGLLLRAENDEAKVAFKRDAAGRVIKETQGEHSIVRTFDPTGKHVHTESSLGASVDYGHDGQGRLQEMSSGEWTAKWLRDRVGLEAERHLTGGVHVTTRRDKFGRETFKGVGARNVEQLRRRYTWDMGNRLLVARDEISGRVAQYDYDEFDNLIAAEYERNGEIERLYRVPDRMGNLFETRERVDRRYGAGGRLAEDREFFYHYDCEGNLVFKEFKEMALRGGIVAPINKGRLEAELGIRFRAFGTGWRYDWQSDGMLARVVRPDGKEVSFAYDALGRRTRKSFAGTATHFVWDGNVPLHEWTETADSEETVITWLFEQDTFVPAAKLVANGDCFSIISDYLGTPLQAYDKQGNKVWEQELDIYGRQRKRPSSFIPFKYQGQYEDAETGLYYNRFRYYDPKAGSYISQDPIGLAGGNPTLYGYVFDTSSEIDPLGLSNIFTSSTYQAPGKALGGTGNSYKVYQQKIDWDAKFNKAGGGTETNLDKALRGDSPLINKNGKWEPVHLHHSRQRGKGPLFELSESTHLYTTNQNGRKALHPYLPDKHPFDAVDRTAFNNVDKPEYWKQRAKSELETKKLKIISMLSKIIINYLKRNNFYLDKEEKDYVKALLDLGIDLESDLAYFCLHTTEMSFKGRNGSIDNICWYLIYSTYARRIEALQSYLVLPKEYIPLDSFETEGGFFYNRKTGEVLELELGQKLIDFQNGKLQPQWKSFNSFLEWFFELDKI